MKAFAALVASLKKVADDDVSAEVLSASTWGGHDPLPPLFAAHLLLDGREYVLTLVPTDLGERGKAMNGEGL